MRYDQRHPIIQPLMIEIAHWLYMIRTFPLIQEIKNLTEVPRSIGEKLKKNSLLDAEGPIGKYPVWVIEKLF